MTILDKIAEERRLHVREARQAVPYSALEALAAGRKHHSLTSELQAFSGHCVIAEVKKASPSAGLIKADYNPGAIAEAYIASGARGLSVLTEPNHFMGSRGHLESVRRITTLPVLRKDFIVDEYQVAETAAWGADVVLLIAAILPGTRMRALYELARSFGLDVLVESHCLAELERALELPDAVIGINNRNLKNLEISLDISRSLAGAIPRNRFSISESGISAQSEISELAGLGYDGFLIGEALLRGKFMINRAVGTK